MTTKKNSNVFGDIISARQQTAPPEPPKTATSKGGKRNNPDYSPVTVYIPTEVYARAQFEMTRRGRKREMSELFTELLTEWLGKQS